MYSLPFGIYVEEVTLLGDIMHTNLVLDKTDLVNFSDIFDDPFQTNYETKLTDLRNLVTKAFRMAAQKQLTRNVYTSINATRPLLNAINFYAKQASRHGTLNIALKDFGIISSRKAMNRKDITELVLNLETVKQNIASNNSQANPALGTEGYKPALDTAFNNHITLLQKSKSDQQAIIDANQIALDANRGLFIDFFDDIITISDAGKVVFASNRVKKADYTISKIKARIRHTVTHHATDDGQEYLLDVPVGGIAIAEGTYRPADTINVANETMAVLGLFATAPTKNPQETEKVFKLEPGDEANILFANLGMDDTCTQLNVINYSEDIEGQVSILIVTP